MEFSEELSKKIVSIKILNKPLIVAICGAADLGKTHLAMDLADSLNKLGTSANHITLDSYLITRSKRIELGLSGYEVESYDLEAIQNDLVMFLQGLSIEFCEYDHSKGIADGHKNIIQSCSVLIVDGLHSMHEKFEPLIGYSIFVCTDDYQLQNIRHRADITKRVQTIEFSKSNLDSEFEKYKIHVAPYKNKANIVLTLIKEWQYSLYINE